MPHKTFDWKMYRYIPNLVGPIIGILIFSVFAILHTRHWLKHRNHVIIWTVVGAICQCPITPAFLWQARANLRAIGEVGGYAARIGSHYNNQSWACFITSGVLLLVGPLFFAATIYIMLGRTIRLADGENLSIIKSKWCTRLFVAADVSTLIIQGLGASIMGTMKLALAIAGQRVVIAGLSLQVATFVVFLVVATDFYVRKNRDPRPEATTATSKEWKKLLHILYAVSSLILFRCIFRLVEYAMGNAAYLMAHEWTLYVFDTTPMFLVVLLMLVLEPTKYMHQEKDTSDGSDSEAVGVVSVEERK